ncbi:MAG: CZB domain-containing protein, partial [Gallionella sp.]|nr:CZB domain-containing protein [Gallionella sp.]
ILWKARLGHHVRGSIREPLESALVGQDGICQLGNWINGSAFEPLRGSAIYQQLHDAHRQFHQMGALIIERLEAGDHSDAERIFVNEYSQSLRHIIQSLVAINKILQEDSIADSSI